MLTKRQKGTAIKDVQSHDKDTGGSAVQAAILSKQIEELAKHLKKNPKDTHSRRGLLGMVAKRQKTLKYVEKKDPRKHKSLLKKLNLK
jgi:small subunit ribosomal protein S15